MLEHLYGGECTPGSGNIPGLAAVWCSDVVKKFYAVFDKVGENKLSHYSARNHTFGNTGGRDPSFNRTT